MRVSVADAAALNQELELGGLLVRFGFQETGETRIWNPFKKEVFERAPENIGVKRPPFWAIEISFWPSFEEEHGIGVLWHRDRIIGCGYAYDVQPDKDYHPDH